MLCSKLSGAVALCVVALAPFANAATTFSSDRAAFEAANVLGSTVDFEGEAEFPAGAFNVLDGPVNFGGLTFDTTDNSSLLAGGTGWSDQASNVLFANFFADSLEIGVGPGVTAFGLDIVSELANANVLVSVFDAASNLLGSTSVSALSDGTLTFLGIISDTEIARLTLDSGAGTSAGVDNLAFGVVPLPLPLAMLLGGVGVLGCLGARKRQT